MTGTPQGRPNIGIVHPYARRITSPSVSYGDRYTIKLSGMLQRVVNNTRCSTWKCTDVLPYHQKRKGLQEERHISQLGWESWSQRIPSQVPPVKRTFKQLIHERRES